MKKGLLTSIICFTSLVLFSCGSKTVKVTLSGDEYIEWEKATDTAKVYKEYVVKARSKVKGYSLYIEDLEVKVDNTTLFGDEPSSEKKEGNFLYDSDKLTLTIYKESVNGNIQISGKGALKITMLKINVPAGYYNGITSVASEPHNIESGYGPKQISPIDSTKFLKTKDQIEVIPNDVNFTYELSQDKKTASFGIAKEEFYRDITVTFPNLD